MLSELWIDTELTLFIFTSFYNVQKVMIYNRKQHGCPGVDYYGNMASDTYLFLPKLGSLSLITAILVFTAFL